MTDLLTQLLNVGLIEKIDGNDDRFTKMESAAVAVAQELRDQPSLLIRAILAGLDPDIPDDDPALVQAENALINEWKSMRSVHTDRPVNLLRAILLAACNLAADAGDNAEILWLTAADTLPMVRLGKEELIVRNMLKKWSAIAEKESLTFSKISTDTHNKEIELNIPNSLKASQLNPRKIDRNQLLNSVAAAVGPNYKNKPTNNANPNWASRYDENEQWHWEFSDRLSALLGKQFELVASTSDINNLLINYNKQIEAFISTVISTTKSALISQQSSIQTTQQSEQPRLNALWWSEALYSSSLTCSYRELPRTIATVVMAIDLLDVVTKPTPASVGYLLAEAVNRLPEAGFDRKLTLQDLLIALAKDCSQLPKTWLETLIPPPETGRLSLRDLVVLVLANPSTDIATAIKRTGASGDFELSLPKFAHALFRQEQAVQLAGSGL